MKLAFAKPVAGSCVLFSLVSLILLSFPVHAQVDTFQFDTIEQQQRFRKLSDELRCPMCQNTSLTGSTGGVAQDLRREIHRMIMAGQSNGEIKQFMFERYGDFIFYRPRLRAQTILLWFGPVLFLLSGAFIAYRIQRRASRPDQISKELTEEETEKLQIFLKRTNTPTNSLQGD